MNESVEVEFEASALEATTWEASVVEVEVLEWVEAVAPRSPLLLFWV